MPWLVGLDEAGYGPNLGPLLIAATVWEVPTDPSRCDLYEQFAPIVATARSVEPASLRIADSKQVYTPGLGLELLERGVLAGWALSRNQFRTLPSHAASDSDSVARLAIPDPQTFRGLVTDLAIGNAALDDEPWYQNADITLPVACPTFPHSAVSEWTRRCQQRQIRLAHVGIDLVSPQRFNALNRQTGSKGRSLSQLSLCLLRACLERAGVSPADSVVIVGDKHGGRNRYHEFLPLAFDQTFIQCLEEGPERSRYRVGKAEIRFETRAERHLPVALASMVAKYLRELAMRLFNDFWQAQIPGLRATAGYPVDAARFREEIAGRQRELSIPEELLWREK